MIAIAGGTVHTPDRSVADGVVLIDGAHIEAVGTAAEIGIPHGSERIEAGGLHVASGLIDVHTHGLLGHDLMGPALADAVGQYPQFGVTSFLATTVTLPQAETEAALGAMADVLHSPPPGARCLGIHVEGPHLSPRWPGMATPEWFRPLDQLEFEKLQTLAGGWIRMITFAPEEGRAMEAIPFLTQSGVIPVIGHSDATFAQVEEAVSLGLTQATHTFNAMRSFHHREPGVVGGVLHFDSIFAQLIADGVHVHPAAIRLLLRAKGPGKVVLISDSSPLAGLPPGEYEWNHKRIFAREGRCELEDGTLAGAHASLDTGLRTLVHSLGLPLSEALEMAARTPAASLGLERKGVLAPGYDADVVLLDDQLHPVQTFVEGKSAWGRG